jgi:rfaE bifunctional protein kinase chain/domain
VIPRGRLHEIVDGFAGRRVVVYGDLVLDRFVLGTPKRISREAPVIILRFDEQRDLPGGGANALANVAALGGAPVAVGVVGDDEPGRALLAALAASGVDCADVVTQTGFRTITKVRLLAGGPSALKFQVARFDVEDHLPAGQAPQADLANRLARLAATARAAAVSDYGYGTVTPDNVARLRSALPPGALIVADSRFSLTGLGQVDGATPNLEELAALAGRAPSSDDEVAAAAEMLRQRLDARFVVATRGSHGLSLIELGRPPLHEPVFGTDQVADVTGAGDTVLATITLALAAGAEPAEAATLANLAGGVVVTKLGTATLSREELHRAIDLAPFVGG